MAPPPGASCVDADMLVSSQAFWSLGLTSGERGGGKPGIGIVPAVGFRPKAFSCVVHGRFATWKGLPGGRHNLNGYGCPRP